MAKRTVGDWDGEGKREAGAAGLDEALSALSKSMAALSKSMAALSKSMAALAKELAARLMESGSSAPRVDGLVREAVLEAGCRGLEEAAEGDRSDCGAANAPRCCRGRMRYAGRERSATETALGRVRLAMGRYVCLSCGKSARPRASRLDVEGSMTPTARRMASEPGVGVLLRGGGPAAERGGRGELRGEAGGADDAAGWRRPGAVADGVAVGIDHGRRRGRGGVERRVVRRGAGSPAVAGRTDSVRWTGRHGDSRAAVGDGGAEGEGRRARDDAGSQGRPCPSGGARCATPSTARSACRSVRGASRRPARRWWGGA